MISGGLLVSLHESLLASCLPRTIAEDDPLDSQDGLQRREAVKVLRSFVRRWVSSAASVKFSTQQSTVEVHRCCSPFHFVYIDSAPASIIRNDGHNGLLMRLNRSSFR